VHCHGGMWWYKFWDGQRWINTFVLRKSHDLCHDTRILSITGFMRFYYEQNVNPLLNDGPTLTQIETNYNDLPDDEREVYLPYCVLTIDSL